MNNSLTNLPDSHPHRQELNDEVHARPPEPLQAPMRVSHLVCFSDSVTREAEQQAINDLAQAFDVPPPGPEANHYRAELGGITVKWERHTEFTGYTFFAQGQSDTLFEEPAISLVPADWLAALPGKILLATHVALLAEDAASLNQVRIALEHFNGNVLIGAGVAEGTGLVLTDFRIHEDGFSRFVVANGHMTPPQSGRMIQRLLEIESYRMMALLALPTARALSPFLSTRERELVDITAALAGSEDTDEPFLLNRLTRLQADIESHHADNKYRFDAANAYYALVQRRIDELRETRIPGLQTFREFTERRLAPAIDTCRAVAVRQNSVSHGVARATQLLSTRVDMTRRQQNQSVLESMDRRAGLQLRLQEAVETLSIVAVTYYSIGLIGYASDGIGELGFAPNTSLIKIVSMPFVVAAVLAVMWRVRKKASSNLETP